ncbi:DUF4652 domain-containing protein (plasmid) [Alkalihalophilus sp. As8PL]|uniref:DUF4652 domain-containing protein n=1 Tax=Alkalihalophilus sp. As8PL TaxID=3237103 RepID=A0AB39BP47_9BACI
MMFDIRLNSKTEKVELVYPNGNCDILADNAPGEPVKSPNNKHAVYISPLEWEEQGTLYLVDLENGDQKILVEPAGDWIPKNVLWQDDERVFVIIGYGHGTLSVGGNIFSVNVSTKEKLQITQYESDIQILDFKIEDGILYYNGIKYTDSNYEKSETYTNNISLDSMLS